MKKLLTLCAAVLASFSMWAADPVISTYDWENNVTKYADVVKTYSDEGIVVSSYNATSLSNNSAVVKGSTRMQYLSYSSNATALNNYHLRIKSTEDIIDSVAIFWCPNGTNKTQPAWIAWADGVEPSLEVSAYGVFDAVTSSRSYDNAVWYTINLSGKSIKEIAIARSWRASQTCGGQSTGNLGEGQTMNILGFKIWTSPAVSDEPVTSCAIAGDETAYVGFPKTYTATAAGASTYAWYVDGTLQDGETDKKFVYTADATGTHTIYATATNEHTTTPVASNEIAVNVTKVSGELIKATHTGAKTATVTGLIGGTADKSTENGGKINSNGYFGIQLASGKFQEGDTLVVNIGNVSTSGGAVLIVYAEKEAENVILNTEVAGVSGDNKFVLPAAINNKNALYIVRTSANAWNAVVNSISVIRPKAVKSTTEVLKAVTIDSSAISSDQLTSLKADESLDIATSYLNAPVVVFTKTVTTIYEDNSQTTKDVDIEVEATVNDEGKWAASATINETEYTITMAKTASFTVHYMDGETELGTENVAANDTVADYANYQSKQLASFVGWYDDAELTEAADLTAPITAETYLYAKFENIYATSVNIEQLILDNGTGYNIKTGVINGNNGFASNYSSGDISNDSLKALADAADRNYPYLGLKVKVSSLLNFRLEAGKTLNIKIGAIKSDKPQISFNGGAYADMDLTTLYADQAEAVKYYVYTHTAEAEELVSIKTVNANAVVFKQIMIDEDIQEFVLPALYTVTFNAGDGTCATETIGTQFAGDKIVLPAATAPSGYKFIGWFTDATEGEEVGKAEAEYTPTADITLYAQYSETTAIGNTEAAVKAVKVIRDGQVLIIREGKTFNVMGAEVK